MNSMYKKSLFIFRRDLRVHDNTGLIRSLTLSEHVIPCFIFDPRQVEQANQYRSLNALHYMIESLQDLQEQLDSKGGKLYLFYGIAHEVVQDIIVQESIDAVFLNNDYTPFSIERDEAIKKVCLSHQLAFEPTDDLLLNPPDRIMTITKTPYARFTPFYKKALTISIDLPKDTIFTNYYRKPIKNSQEKSIYKKILTKFNDHLNLRGGTKPAENIIASLASFNHYERERDIPAIATTHLSAPLKFGTLSIRHVYHAIKAELGSAHPLLRQLYWRDFYTYIAYHSPFVFGHAFQKKYDHVWWNNDTDDFARWCAGQTGFPIVDAGMRQLNETGFMHNRVRMIVASFLTKDLHIDWQWGERYFAQQLLDYDPAVNNGNWQWAASTGCDAQPYFRIFNPWLQQKKFDPDCVYIKRWIPELHHVDPKIIHSWYNQKQVPLSHYPKPIVDHRQESMLAKKVFKSH